MDDVCPVCGISLLRINLARHLRTHDENPQFLCEICDKFFKTNNSLSQHKRTNRKPEDIPCSFPSCSAILHSRSAMRKHVKTKHENLKYMCSYCTKSFSTESYAREFHSTLYFSCEANRSRCRSISCHLTKLLRCFGMCKCLQFLLRLDPI